MKNLLVAAALLVGLCSPAIAAQGYTLGPTISTTTGRATQAIAGTFYTAASSATISTPTITLNGATGVITATSFSGALATGLDVTGPPYNAVCDGTTNDATALSLCAADSYRLGKACLIPNRQCATSSAIVVSSAANITGIGPDSEIVFNTTGGGTCGLGSNGLVRLTSTSGGSSERYLKNLILTANTAGAGCILNASAATGQVSNTTLDHVRFYDNTGSSSIIGTLLGNTVSFTVTGDSYWSPMAQPIRSLGSFLNAIKFDHFFVDAQPGASTDTFQAEIGSFSGEINSCSITNGVFESGPNSLRLVNANGCQVNSIYFGDVISQPSSSTWVTVYGGHANHVGPLYKNSEGSNTMMSCVKAVDTSALSISGVMCDSAQIAFDIEASTVIVQGNNCFFPGQYCVKLSSSSGGLIGPNVETGNFATGSRYPVYCDGGSNGNRIITRYPNRSNVSYTDNCKQNNIVENLSDRTLNGLLGPFAVGNTTAPLASFNNDGTVSMGGAPDASWSFQFKKRTSEPEVTFGTHNGFLADTGSDIWRKQIGTLAKVDFGLNNNNFGIFDIGDYGDAYIMNWRPAGHSGGVKLGVNGSFMLDVEDGLVRFGTNTYTSYFNEWGGFTMPVGSSATLSSVSASSMSLSLSLTLPNIVITSTRSQVNVDLVVSSHTAVFDGSASTYSVIASSGLKVGWGVLAETDGNAAVIAHAITGTGQSAEFQMILGTIADALVDFRWINDNGTGKFQSNSGSGWTNEASIAAGTSWTFNNSVTGLGSITATNSLRAANTVISSTRTQINADVVASSGVVHFNGTGSNTLFKLTTSSGVNVAAGTLLVAETVEANKFKGDGSQLTGISGAVNGLTSGFIPRASGSSSLVDGTLFATSTGASSNLPITIQAGGSLNFNEYWTAAGAKGSTFTLAGNHPTCAGMECVQASTSPAGQIVTSFTGLDSNADYEVVISTYYEVIGGNGCYWKMTLNGSGASVYEWFGSQMTQASTFLSPNSSASDTSCTLAYTSNNGPGTTRGGTGSIKFHTYTSSEQNIMWENTQHNSSVNTRQIGTCTFKGGTITQITIYQPGGCVWAGTIKLIKKP